MTCCEVCAYEELLRLAARTACTGRIHATSQHLLPFQRESACRGPPATSCRTTHPTVGTEAQLLAELLLAELKPRACGERARY